MKIRKTYLKLLALLPIPFILASCDLSDCDIETKHAHKYVHSDNKGNIVNYLIDEQKIINNYYRVPNVVLDENYTEKMISYTWTNESIELTNDDEAFIKIKGDLFNGLDNWDYLYNIMLNNHDHLEYNYIYDDGEDKHNRWRNYYDRQDHHTGIVRVFHVKYYGYKIVYKDGSYQKIKSPLVDDIREIIDEYPFMNIGCMKTVYKDYQFKVNDLGKIKLSDIDEFKQPDLLTNKLHISEK